MILQRLQSKVREAERGERQARKATTTRANGEAKIWPIQSFDVNRGIITDGVLYSWSLWPLIFNTGRRSGTGRATARLGRQDFPGVSYTHSAQSCFQNITFISDEAEKEEYESFKRFLDNEKTKAKTAEPRASAVDSWSKIYGGV